VPLPEESKLGGAIRIRFLEFDYRTGQHSGEVGKRNRPALGACTLKQAHVGLVKAKADIQIHLGTLDALNGTKSPDSRAAIPHEAGVAAKTDILLAKSSQPGNVLSIRVAAKEVLPPAVLGIKCGVPHLDQLEPQAWLDIVEGGILRPSNAAVVKLNRFGEISPPCC
jgi:hypothetical protein